MAKSEKSVKAYETSDILLSGRVCAAGRTAVLAQPRVGMTDTTAYFPLLEGRRVAVLANQTSVADMPGAPAPTPPGGFIWSICCTGEDSA